MNDLRELYQEVILDHSKNPRNFREMADANRSAEGHNPLCGDRVTVFLHMDGDKIQDVSFKGNGCAISTASSSMLTEMLKGKTQKDALEIFHTFHHLVTGQDEEANAVDLGKLGIFEGVKEFPLRVKCATLGWHTLVAALENKHEVVKTE